MSDIYVIITIILLITIISTVIDMQGVIIKMVDIILPLLCQALRPNSCHFPHKKPAATKCLKYVI